MSKESPGLEIDGTRLRQLRKLSGSNLVTFAKSVGISWGYLSQIELGHRKTVGPEVFGRICDELGIERNARHTLLLTKAAA